MKQQIKYYIAKAGGLLNLKSVAIAIVPLVFAVQLVVPQPVLAQDCTASAQNTTATGNETTDTDSTNGVDFEITCEGELDEDFVVNTQVHLGDEADDEFDYDESESSVIIDVSKVDGNSHGITIRSDAGKTVLTGSITNDDTAPEQDSVVSVSEVDPADGPLYDVIFESRATIGSDGDGRTGLSARIDSGNNEARSVLNVTNSGTITTEGDKAEGLSAGAGASENKANRIYVTNTGTITTSGNEASGLSAYFELDSEDDANADALGRVEVTNSGTISVSGNGTGGKFITGLEAVYRTAQGQSESILNSGNVRIENSGEITMSGNRAKGIYTLTEGRGDIDIDVSGGTIEAGNPGSSDKEEDDSSTTVPKKFGIGIHAKADTDHPEGTAEETPTDSDGDVDVTIVITGSGASIMAYGAASDNNTTSFDESKGIAILAETGAATGQSHVTISSGAKVSGLAGTEEGSGYAVMFKGGKGILDINSANLVGDVMFTSQDDVLNIENTGSIEGSVDFGGGEDTMNINIEEDHRFQITGDVTGLTTLSKKGAGYARLGGDLTFRGESTLNLEDGALVIAGKMNLGSGEVTVHKAGRIVFEIGGDGTTGSITAGSIHFEEIGADDVSVYAQLNDDLEEEEVTAARTGLTSDTHELLNVNSITSGDSDSPEDVDRLSIMTVKANDETVSVGSIAYANNVGTAAFDPDKVDQIAKLNPGPPAPVSPGGDDDNNDAILGLGLVAVLVALYWGDGLFGSSFADDYAFNTPQSAYIASVDERSTLTLRETGNQPYQVWIRSSLEDTMQLAGVKNAGVSGTEIGLSLYRSDDFYIEASSAQDVAAQVSSLNQSAQGEVYALSSGWQNERYFAGVKLSYGDFDTDTVIDNPVVKSTLTSQSEVRHTQAQFTAGTRWNTGNLMFTPSASVQAGTFDYSAHQAQGAVVNAEVPSYTQDYSALRVGLKMSASDWLSLSDNVKWKPHLQFDQIHTDSGSGGDVTLHQMDRLGALSFNSGASVQSMPEVVNAVSFGTSVKTSKSTSQSEWKFGYAGLEADGEYYHAAVAAYQMRF